MPKNRFELLTHGFSIRCSTNWATSAYMAYPDRIERSTFSFGDYCSAWLSYGYINLEEDNRIELSPIPRWAGFQDQLTPSVPILRIEFVSSITIVIDTIHLFIQGRPGLGTSLGILVQLATICTALPSSRESNPSPSTISVVRTYLDSVTFSCWHLQNLVYEAGLAPCYHHTSLFRKVLLAPSLFWLSYINLVG